MKRFHFRLEPLLKLKQQRAWLAELAVQKARLATEAARTRVQTLKLDLETIARQVHTGLVAADRWPAAYAQSARVGRDLLGAEAEVVQAEFRLREASIQCTRQLQEVETLLHLRDQAWQTHKDDTAVAEQQRVDELSMQRWQAARTSSLRANSVSEGERP